MFRKSFCQLAFSVYFNYYCILVCVLFLSLKSLEFSFKLQAIFITTKLHAKVN